MSDGGPARITGTKRSKRRREIEQLIELYRQRHPELDGSALEPHLVAAWGIQHGWRRPPLTPEEMLRKDLSKYLQTEYTQDPQGRRVRKHHAILYTVMTPDGAKRRSQWHTIDEAPAKHMAASLQLRRGYAFSDAKQVELDWSSWNDNNIFGEQLPPMDFDFNKDIEESKLPTHYPSTPPGGSDDDDDEDDDI